MGYLTREPRAALGGEDAPAQEAVQTFEQWTLAPTFEQLLQYRVQRFRFLRGEP